MTTIYRLMTGDRVTARRWDEFVYAHLESSFFHRAGWQTIIERAFRHKTYFLFAENEGRIDGVLPLAFVNSLIFGKSLVSLPFAVYGGIVASTNAVAGDLERAASELASQLGADRLEFRNLRSRHANEWPVQDLYVTFRKRIVRNAEENMLGIPRKQRAMVRRGIKNGLSSELGRDLDAFFLLYSDNVHRHGTPALPKRYFRFLLDEFGNDCNILVVRDNAGVNISAVLSFYFRDEVLPYYAGDNYRARDLAANDLKYWELMKYSAEKGINIFDFGRSKQSSGSFAFKKNWGFTPSPLYYEYCLYGRKDIPQINPSNKKFQLLIETWKRMPLACANWLGPHVVRNLG